MVSINQEITFTENLILTTGILARAIPMPNSDITFDRIWQE